MTPRIIMDPTNNEPNLMVWGDGFDENTIEQAQRSARLPHVESYVALMPDAHFGYGATVGSVIATRGAVIPSAIGVDIGCGMVAVHTNLTSNDLPDSMGAMMPFMRAGIPAGVGKAKLEAKVNPFELIGKPATDLTARQQETAALQCGSLGGGNHFAEVCLDQNDEVWLVLHSGSRGIGNQLAEISIDMAKQRAGQWKIPLEDPDLAYLIEYTPEFDTYIADMLWAQEYAKLNRTTMMERFVWSLESLLRRKVEAVETINCHHNFCEMEHHHEKNVWVTRKGAIRARTGDRGVIPGSMGTRSYIVEGLGNHASFMSSSHGAGRRLSRNAARKKYTAQDLSQRMEGKTWNSHEAAQLVDEIPDAYKDIDEVMAAQSDLVAITHTLHQILNYKGTR